jgi:FkbM family methyltransferase
MSASPASYLKQITGRINSRDEQLSSTKELLSQGGRRIYLHGAGNFGTATCKLLEEAGHAVSGFIDKSAGADHLHLGKKVFATAPALDQQQFDKDEDIIVIGFICDEQTLLGVRSSYHAQGYRKVLYFLNIYALFITGNLATEASSSFQVTPLFGVRFDQVKERILQVAALWRDEESRKTYDSFLEAILSGNSCKFAAATGQAQYFVEDVPFHKGYSRFLDCGAFDGDTAFALKLYKGGARALACFEPDPVNYLRLSQALSRERVASEQILFPCGVWEKSEMLRFRSGQQSTSGISDTGDTFLQCVSIDQALPDFRPSFIKMDVEGAEYQALTGAERTLTTQSPDLAISVYHRIEHMWEIPLLIKGMSAGYQFYLRSHGEYGVETIMYATRS